MHRRFQSTGEGRVEPKRDAAWEEDLRRELIGGILETERLATPANLVCWFIVLIAVVWSEDLTAFLFPLAFRLVAMVGTRTAFARMRAKLAAGGEYVREERMVLAALLFGGMAWGSVLVPLTTLMAEHRVSILAGGATAVGIGIIISLLAPVLRWAAAFALGVIAIALGGVAWLAPGMLVITIYDLAGLFAIFVSYGFAAVGSQRKSAQLHVDNVRLGEGLAESLAQTQALALTDALTGLPNRRALFEEAARRKPCPSQAILLLDIDHFKSINDSFGHAVGDRVLAGTGAALARVLATRKENKGFAARIGGEEFAIIVSADELVAIRALAEDLREALSLAAGDLAIEGLAVTASVGIAIWHRDMDFDEVLGRADLALYEAKTLGRDRLALA